MTAPLPIEQFDPDALTGLELGSVYIDTEQGLILSFIDHTPHLGEYITITFDEWRMLQITDGLGCVTSCSFLAAAPGSSDLERETEYILRLTLKYEFSDDQSQLEVRVSQDFVKQRKWPARGD